MLQSFCRCSVLQCVAVSCSVISHLRCAAVRCMILMEYVAVFFLLQCVAGCCRMMLLQCVAVCCNITLLQCVAVCVVAVCCSMCAYHMYCYE